MCVCEGFRAFELTGLASTAGQNHTQREKSQPKLYASIFSDVLNYNTGGVKSLIFMMVFIQFMSQQKPHFSPRNTTQASQRRKPKKVKYIVQITFAKGLIYLLKVVIFYK